MSTEICYVQIQLPGTFEWVPCGVLSVEEQGAGAYLGTFHYGRRYLARSQGLALNPYRMPLTDKPLTFTKLKGIPGALRDASPDYWGRRVIQAKLERKEEDISEIEYLLNGPDDGAGNLRFEHSPTGAPAERPFNRTHQLEALAAAADALEEDGRLPYEVLETLEPGTSMGGARPKVTIEDEHQIWLAKLPEKRDKANMQRIEYATLELARAAGINVCGTRLERVGRADALLLSRFDREWNPDAGAYARYGLISGLTAVDADDGYLGRERWSYPLLADEIRRWSVRPDEDRMELFKRMVFNAMVTNNDDHPRNHAFLHSSNGWRLSPAYDIVPVPMVARERRDLALTVGAFGRVASMFNLLSSCRVFGLSQGDAENIIASMLTVVQNWRTHFEQHGVCQSDIAFIEPAMLPDCFFRTEPVQPV